MRRIRPYLIVGICLAVFACSKKDVDGVQKIDLSREPTSKDGIFQVSETSSNLIKIIVRAAEKQDQKSRFSDKFSKSYGKPVWDKSEAMLSPGSRASRGCSIDTTVLIPLVKDGQRIVSSMLACLVTKDTVLFQLYRGSAYKFYPYTMGGDKLNANQIAVQMMALQRKVFGDSTFTLLDDQLFRFVKNRDRSGKRTVLIRPSTTSTNKVEQIVYTTCYNVDYDGDEGQLIGTAPGESNNYSYTETVCVVSSVYVWSPDDYTGGGGGDGSGNPSSGGSGGGSGSDPCGPTENRNMRTVAPGDCGGDPGWEPSPYPPLSGYDWTVINNLATEMKDVDDHWESPCHSTARLGNIRFQGTIEHWVIQLDFLTSTPGANVEYYIPGAGPSGVAGGYADMVNSLTNEMFEIKPNNDQGVLAGRTEVQNYVTKATANCGNGTYQKGTDYATRFLPYPKDPTKALKASLKENGVIVYDVVGKELSPVPLTIPQNIKDKIKDLVKKITAASTNVEPIMLYWLKMNPEVVTYIKGAAIGVAITLIAGTIIEDVLTAGAGVADDWQSFLLAYKLSKFALAL